MFEFPHVAVLILLVSQFMAALCDIFGSGDQMRSLRTAVLSYKDEKSVELFEGKLKDLVRNADTHRNWSTRDSADMIATKTDQWNRTQMLQAMTAVAREEKMGKSSWEKRANTRWNPAAERERAVAVKADVINKQHAQDEPVIIHKMTPAILARTASHIRQGAADLRLDAEKAKEVAQESQDTELKGTLMKSAANLVVQAEQSDTLAGELLEEAEKQATVPHYASVTLCTVYCTVSTVLCLLFCVLLCLTVVVCHCLCLTVAVCSGEGLA